MCNAYNLRHRNEAILDIARAMQLPLADLPEFPPRHRIGIKQRGLILRPGGDGALAWSWARWSLVPPGAQGAAALPAQQRPRRTSSARGRGRPCSASAAWSRPAASGSRRSPPGRQGAAPWSYYSMKDGRPFFMAGLWAEAHDPATGEVADTYTVIITDANAAMRVHDRMPVILATDAARRWVEPGPLPAELLAPYPAEAMAAWRVGDDAKNSRIEPHAGMAEAVPESDGAASCCRPSGREPVVLGATRLVPARCPGLSICPSRARVRQSTIASVRVIHNRFYSVGRPQTSMIDREPPNAARSCGPSLMMRLNASEAAGWRPPRLAQMRRNDASSALGSRPPGEFRYKPRRTNGRYAR